MAEIKVTVARVVTAEPTAVIEALGDYKGVRAETWPETITDYEVLEGGTGAGTRIRYKLHATRSRVRTVEAVVSAPEPDRTLVEADQNSTLRTVWTVQPVSSGTTRVSVETSWAGASGIGGFFERTFAPIGIRKLYNGVLDKLAPRLVPSA
ncbi:MULTISPECIES: SRPBCC family protein [Protofrankia]|uniref:Polyketide cyclase/dehydrase n=1 Tax=Candidatus Protofrankia datiscae TaxID=2716812 RepID=F8B5F1_9ACTN|nr:MULTISPECIES: SRPBCC family protein [Protofrankia]AEH08006.1 Polyketide cyclase/dehydrase [Candidatus Protofrankia datiscae]